MTMTLAVTMMKYLVIPSVQRPLGLFIELVYAIIHESTAMQLQTHFRQQKRSQQITKWAIIFYFEKDESALSG